ncbi:MAG TPA: LuxR C-terminal-related transcriptional regulator [Candidatus Saccharimonadales bacterium]|nr:LuxR C-terminal-related transcriptional regulator [Candidatus Saccharimonadales bacterium]
MNYEQTAYMPELTHREWEVFWLSATERLSNQEIADCLRVGLPTVKTHKRNIRLALGVQGRTSIPDWYEQNRELAANEWFKKIAPEHADDGMDGQGHEAIYAFLASTADSRNSILASLKYIDSLPPIVGAFVKCHVELMRLSGVIIERESPAHAYLAGGPRDNAGTAQDKGLDQKDDDGLALLSDQILVARQSALGILAATSALLDKVNERREQQDVDSLQMPISNIVEAA